MRTRKIKITRAELEKVEIYCDIHDKPLSDVLLMPSSERQALMKDPIAKTKHWRVRCVNTSGIRKGKHEYPNGPLKKGRVYLVDQVSHGGYILRGCSSILEGQEVGWRVSRFQILR